MVNVFYLLLIANTYGAEPVGYYNSMNQCLKAAHFYREERHIAYGCAKYDLDGKSIIWPGISKPE